MRSLCLLIALSSLAMGQAAAQTAPTSGDTTLTPRAATIFAEAINRSTGWCSVANSAIPPVLAQVLERDYEWLIHPSHGAETKLLAHTAGFHEAFVERIQRDLRSVRGLAGRLRQCMTSYRAYLRQTPAGNETTFLQSIAANPSPCTSANPRQKGIFTHPQHLDRPGWVNELRATLVQQFTAEESPELRGIICPPQAEPYSNASNALFGGPARPLCRVKDLDQAFAEQGVPRGTPGNETFALQPRPSLGVRQSIIRPLIHVILPEILTGNPQRPTFRICSIQLDHPSMSFLSTAGGIRSCRSWSPRMPVRIAANVIDAQAWFANHFAPAVSSRMMRENPNAAALHEAITHDTVPPSGRFIERVRGQMCVQAEYLREVWMTNRSFGQVAPRALVESPALEQSPHALHNLFLPILPPGALLARTLANPESAGSASVSSTDDTPVTPIDLIPVPIGGPTDQSISAEGVEAGSSPYDVTQMPLWNGRDDHFHVPAGSGPMHPAVPAPNSVRPAASVPVQMGAVPVVQQPQFLVPGSSR